MVGLSSGEPGAPGEDQPGSCTPGPRHSKGLTIIATVRTTRRASAPAGTGRSECPRLRIEIDEAPSWSPSQSGSARCLRRCGGGLAGLSSSVTAPRSAIWRVGPLPGRRCVRTATSAMPCPMNRWEPACNSDGANASLGVAEALAGARLSGSCVSEGSLLASSCGPGMPMPPSWQAPSPRPP